MDAVEVICDCCQSRQATIVELKPWAQPGCFVVAYCKACAERDDSEGYWFTIRDYTHGTMREHLRHTKGGGIHETDHRLSMRLSDEIIVRFKYEGR